MSDQSRKRSPANGDGQPHVSRAEAERRLHAPADASGLQDTIRRHAYILSQLQEGVICTDVNGVVTYWNQAAERIWGWSSEEMMGRPVFDRLPAGEARAWGRERFDLVMEGKESFGVRHDYRKDGARVWLDVRTSPMTDSHGHPTGIVTIARDITERIQAEEKIHQSQKMMAAAERLAQFGSWEIDLTHPDLNRNQLRWSDEVFRIFGYEPTTEPISNEWFYRRIPPEDHSAIMQAVSRAIAERGVYSIEHRVVRPSGEVRFVHEQAQVFCDERTGLPRRMIGTVHDITERRKQELELRRSEDQFRSAMQHSSIGMALVGLEGKWLKVNPALCKIVGYTEAEMLVTDFQSITHPADLESDLALVHRLLVGEISTYQLEKRYFHKDGHVIWILLSVSLVRGDDGRPLYFISQIQDISARKQVMEELVKAKDAAEAAARTKSEFLAMISHEIRTPLNPILGAVQLLLDQKCAPEQRELLQIIHNAGEHLLTLLNDILDLAKMEAGAEELSLAPARLGELIQSVLDIKSEDARRKKLVLRAEIADGLAYAYLLDEPRVRQILLNLVGNAIKFTERGTITARVERIASGRERDQLRFSVRDSGIGISPEHAARIFEPFFQVDSSSSRRYEGAGLGLAICRRLVEIMCGQIGVESQPGQGATFWFTTWLERRQAITGSGTPWPMPLVSLRARRVLLVEDDERTRVVLLTMLERAGCEVTVAETGAGALSLFQPGAYELVLLDLHLPDLDGPETVALFRQREKAAQVAPVPIIGHGDSREIERLRNGLAVGIDGFLPHPIRQVEVMKLLNRHVPAPAVPPPTSNELPPGGVACIG